MGFSRFWWVYPKKPAVCLPVLSVSSGKNVTDSPAMLSVECWVGLVTVQLAILSVTFCNVPVRCMFVQPLAGRLYWRWVSHTRLLVSTSCWCCLYEWLHYSVVALCSCDIVSWTLDDCIPCSCTTPALFDMTASRHGCSIYQGWKVGPKKTSKV